MDDLISRKSVETAIKEFFKKQVDKLPKHTEFEEMFDLCGMYLELNVDLLNEVEHIPVAYDVDKVVEQLEETKCSEEDTNHDFDCYIRNKHVDMCISIVKGAIKDE